MSSRIIRNSIRCAFCGREIESTYQHDFVSHTCEKMKAEHGPDALIAVDGGRSYLRRLFTHRTDYTDTSTTVEIPE